jgi:hypothetical protein
MQIEKDDVDLFVVNYIGKKIWDGLHPIKKLKILKNLEEIQRTVRDR